MSMRGERISVQIHTYVYLFVKGEGVARSGHARFQGHRGLVFESGAAPCTTSQRCLKPLGKHHQSSHTLCAADWAGGRPFIPSSVGASADGR